MLNKYNNILKIKIYAKYPNTVIIKQKESHAYMHMCEFTHFYAFCRREKCTNIGCKIYSRDIEAQDIYIISANSIN